MKELKFKKMSEEEALAIVTMTEKEIIEEHCGVDVELPKVKFKLNDDEFKELLKAIDGKRIPVAMLDEIFPYRIKRDKDGRFIGLPGGLDERSKSLGIRLSRSTYESPETNELFIKIDCNPMTEEEVAEFIKKRDERVKRYQSKSTDDFTRVMCSVCNTRVQIGVQNGEYKVYCTCDESPIDAIDISHLLDVERLKKWK